MNYNTFKKKTVQEIEKQLPPGRKIRLDTVTKLNGNELDAIIITDESSNAFPTLYFRDLYELHRRGMTFDEVIQMAMDSFNVRSYAMNMDIDEVYSFDKIADRLCCRLINTLSNKRMLKNIPSMPFHDLSVVFYLSYENAGEHAIITVDNTMMEYWEKTPADLIDLAQINTMRLNSLTLYSLNDLVSELAEDGSGENEIRKTEIGETEAGETIIRETESAEIETGKTETQTLTKEQSKDATVSALCDVIVITGRYRRNGAVYMLDSELLDSLCESFDDDLVLIPSSIHEVLAAPSKSIECSRINELIRSVNRTAVSPMEILSDHAYIYSGQMHRII